MRVRQGKGDRARVVGIDDRTIDVIERRRALGFDGRHRLVCVISRGRGGPTTPGGRVDVSYIGRMLKRLADRRTRRRQGPPARATPLALLSCAPPEGRAR